MKVFLLGGTGFLGARLASRIMEAWHQVTVVTRDRDRFAAIEASGAAPLQGDILELEPLLGGAGPHDAIINVARPPFEMQRMTNKLMARLQKTTNTFVSNTLALGKKLDCPVIMTQGTAYETAGDEVADESTPLSFQGIAELGVGTPPLFRQAMRCGLPLIRMLPGQIYGPGGLFGDVLYAMMKQGKYRVLGAGDNCCPWVHVHDAASAYLLALEKLPLGEIFILADDVACTWREFADCMAQQMDMPRPGSVPSLAIWLVKGRRIHKTVTLNCRVSNAHAKQVLGWELKYPSFREGIPATVSELEAMEQAQDG